MLKIRLTRRGKKNKAFFRLVVAEHSMPVKGRFAESLGFLNPHTKERDFNEERIKYWLGKGAQCSDSAHNLLVKAGIAKGPKRAVKIRKKAEAKKEEVSEKKPEEAAEEKLEEKKSEEPKKEEKKEKAEEPKIETPKKEEKTEKEVENKEEKKSNEEKPAESK